MPIEGAPVIAAMVDPVPPTPPAGVRPFKQVHPRMGFATPRVHKAADHIPVAPLLLPVSIAVTAVVRPTHYEPPNYFIHVLCVSSDMCVGGKSENHNLYVLWTMIYIRSSF